MCDLPGDKAEHCTNAIQTLSVNIFNNHTALEVIAKRFGVLNIQPGTRGLWVVCIDADSCDDLINTKEIEKELLSGVPFALRFVNKEDEMPMGVLWEKACRFVSMEEAQTFLENLLAHIKRKDENDTFTISISMAPLARVILSGQWEQLEFMMKEYDTETTLAALLGVMSTSDQEKYHVRSILPRLAKPTTFADEGEWEYDHLTSLLGDHMLQSMLRCDELNSRKNRCAAPLTDLKAMDNIIACAFADIIVHNKDLQPITPLSMRAVLLNKEIKAKCCVCGASDANLNCSRCKVYRYCGSECQQKHWKQMRGTHRLAHKHVCPCARTFVMAVAQIPSTVTPELFKRVTGRAVEAVNQFCNALNTHFEEEKKEKNKESI